VHLAAEVGNPNILAILLSGKGDIGEEARVNARNPVNEPLVQNQVFDGVC
jgi:hypothetical protein